MRSLIRRASVYVWHTFVCIFALAVVVAMLWTSLYGISVHRRRRAEQVIQHLATLDLSTLDAAALQQFSKQYGGKTECTGSGCSYDFKEAFAFSSSGPFGPFRRTEWDYVGIRPWQLVAHFKQKGEVTEGEFSILLGRGRGWLFNEGPMSGSMWAWLAVSVSTSAEGFKRSVAIEGQRLGREVSTDKSGIAIRKPNLTIEGSGEALTVDLSPDAPLSARRIAFDLNLRCATSMSPCTELCQFFPSAWQSYARFQKSHGLYVQEPGDCPP